MNLFRRSTVLFTVVAILAVSGFEVRALLTNQKLMRDFKRSWRFLPS